MSGPQQMAGRQVGAPPNLRVLVVEDDPADAAFLRIILDHNERAAIDADFAPSAEEALDRLRGGGFDVVVLDLGLPDSGGLASLAAMTQASDAVPVVVVSGTEDPGLERETVISGAQDFVPKQLLSGSPTGAARILIRSLVAAVDRHAIAQLATAGESNLRRMVEDYPSGIVVLDADGTVVLMNAAARELVATNGIDPRGAPLSALGGLADESGPHQRIVESGGRAILIDLRPTTWYGRDAWLGSVDAQG